jgi:hypothetical protein
LRKSFPAAEVERVLGTQPVRWRQIESGGYGRVMAHWHVELADGRTVFVKQAVSGPDAAGWLRKERLAYEGVRGTFMPEYFGAHDEGDCTFIVIEDLTGADWPPPWSSDRIASVLGALETLRATPPPEGLPLLADMRELLAGWPLVHDDVGPLLSTGVCSRPWLENALPVLLRAAEEVELAGEDLLHLDVRSDNLCFVDSRAILVDWNLACVGNGSFDVAFWLPSLQLEGGPQPDDVLPDAGALAATVAGFFAARAGLPPPEGAPTVREFQRRQAEVALPWAARELDLPPPS